MKITVQQMIDELKKLPPHLELKFKTIPSKETSYKTGKTVEIFEFDRIVFASNPTVELVE